jgi:hypothetical protein
MGAITQNKEKIVCPESTIDSAPRRDFVRKAALTAAGVGVGAAVLGKGVLPKVSASSDCDGCHIFCNIFAGCSVYADEANICTGNGDVKSVTFGHWECEGSCHSISGEGIHSQRAIGCGGCCDNQLGLDFLTDFTNRMRIYPCGKVGINTQKPGDLVSGLSVNGRIKASSVSSTSCGNGTGSIYGVSCKGIGVIGNSSSGVGVQAQSCKTIAFEAATRCVPLVANFENALSASGIGDTSAKIQFQPSDDTISKWNLGVAGECNSLSISPGNFYIEQLGEEERFLIDTEGNAFIDPASLNEGGRLYCGPSLLFGGITSGEGISSNRHCTSPNKDGLDFYTQSTKSTPTPPRMSIANSGNVGIGTPTPGTSLDVAGSFGARIETVSSSYSMAATDFAILADAGSGVATITLPPANTGNGMMVSIKKIDSSSNAVSVAASGADQIEGETSKALSAQYSGLTLISDGTSNWFIVGTSD